MVSIRRLTPVDAPDLIALRKEALQSDPLAFGASPEDDQPLEFVERVLADTANQVVFGFYEAGRLKGMVGVYRDMKVKGRHKAYIWGMYVSAKCRRQGVAGAMLDAAIRQAQEWPGVSQIHLSVSETAAGAKRLYERAGFQEWGREPRSLCWNGTFVDEYHLVLRLNL
jgi:ribosomal protein S18 acetylase RimI-like enzyme